LILKKIIDYFCSKITSNIRLEKQKESIESITYRNRAIKDQLKKDHSEKVNKDNAYLIFFKRAYEILYKSAFKFLNDQSLIISFGLTLKTIFALLPISAIFLGIVSINKDFSEYKVKIIDLLQRYILPESVGGIINLIDKLMVNISTISIFGILLLIYLSLDLFATIDDQFDRMWGVKKKKPFIRKLLVYWALITVVPLFTGVAFYTSVFFQSLSGKIKTITFSSSLLITASSFLIILSIIIALYYIMPNDKINLFKTMIVATIVTLVLMLLRYLFTYYSQLFIINWKIYGSFAVIIFFLIWLTMIWGFLIFGFEVLCVWQNKIYLDRYNFKKFYLYDVAFFIMILKLLSDDFKRNGTGYNEDELSGIIGCSLSDLKEILLSMEQSEMVYFDDKRNSRCHLKKDLSAIELSEIEDVVWRRILIDIHRTPVFFQSICEKLADSYFERKSNSPVFVNDIT